MIYHDLVVALGERAALSLVTALGGLQIYIPKRPDKNGRIAAVIGFDATRTLARHWGGERVVLPKARAQRRAPILDRVARGELSRREAALMLDVTERHMCNLMRGHGRHGGQSGHNTDKQADRPRQPSLFEDL